jgi:hypothetical protein
MKVLRRNTFPSLDMIITFCKFHARDVISYMATSLHFWICTENCSGVVANMVTLSAYATTAVFLCPGRILTSCRCSSNQHISGSRHRAKRIILSGHPCRISQCIGVGADVCLLNWTTKYGILLGVFPVFPLNFQFITLLYTDNLKPTSKT